VLSDGVVAGAPLLPAHDAPLNATEPFLRMLRQVHSVYPAARFEADGRGMHLWNSPPPLIKRLVALPGGQ
jgi:hypothetical protein